MDFLNNLPLECEGMHRKWSWEILGSLKPTTCEPMQISSHEEPQGFMERTGPAVLASPVFVSLRQTWDHKGSSETILILSGCQGEETGTQMTAKYRNTWLVLEVV